MDFSILNNLSFDKKYEKLSEEQLMGYNPFLMNRGFSQFADTVLQSNSMNCRPHIPKQAQFDYYFFSVRKRKRFSKWPKKQKIDSLAYIVDYYECSPREAEMYAKLLSDSDISEIRKAYGERS